MTADQYVESILAKYEVPRGSTSPAERLGTVVAGPLRTWAGQQLNTLQYSGSYAKETGVHGVSDVDVFISLKSDTTNSLKEIYNSLYSLAQQQGWSPRQQNVSVGVTVNGTPAAERVMVKMPGLDPASAAPDVEAETETTFVYSVIRTLSIKVKIKLVRLGSLETVALMS